MARGSIGIALGTMSWPLLYLGFFLLVNVIMTDGTVEGALSPADGQ